MSDNIDYQNICFRLHTEVSDPLIDTAKGRNLLGNTFDLFGEATFKLSNGEEIHVVTVNRLKKIIYDIVEDESMVLRRSGGTFGDFLRQR